MTITDGYAPEPEQSTLALDRTPPAGDLLRHAPGPAAAGRLARRPDPGSARDPSLFGELDDADPPDGAIEDEDEPAMAGEGAG